MGIRLKDGREIDRPRNKMILIGDVQHCDRDLFANMDLRASLGIDEIIRKPHDRKNFIKTGESETVDENGTIIVRPTVVPRRPPAEFAAEIRAKIEAEGLDMIRAARVRYDELQDPDGLIYNPTAAYIQDFEDFRDAVKTAFKTFNDEIKAIVQGRESDPEKYEKLVAYTWADRWPQIRAAE